MEANLKDNLNNVVDVGEKENMDENGNPLPIRTEPLGIGRAVVPMSPKAYQDAPQVISAARSGDVEFLKKWVLKDIPSLGPEWQERYKVLIDEKAILGSSIDFFSKIFDCPVSVINAENAVSRLEPKSKQSAPLRPAIFVS